MYFFPVFITLISLMLIYNIFSIFIYQAWLQIDNVDM